MDVMSRLQPRLANMRVRIEEMRAAEAAQMAALDDDMVAAAERRARAAAAAAEAHSDGGDAGATAAQPPWQPQWGQPQPQPQPQPQQHPGDSGAPLQMSAANQGLMQEIEACIRDTQVRAGGTPHCCLAGGLCAWTFLLLSCCAPVANSLCARCACRAAGPELDGVPFFNASCT
eukprot:366071-Chlamydomonas_euryale.AAC.13